MIERIIIVGAGLAGLSAADNLVRAGRDVQVFEADERVRGRTYTGQAALQILAAQPAQLSCS